MRTPKLKVSGNLEDGKVYLTAGIQPPSDEDKSISSTIKISSDYQSYAGGGSILHVFMNEKMSSTKKANFIKKMFNNFPIRYVSLTPFLSICNSCGEKFVGKRRECSCGSNDLSIWTRPVGYFRPAIRDEISEDYKSSHYRFWSSSRLEEMSNRKNIEEHDFDEFIDELQAGV